MYARTCDNVVHPVYQIYTVKGRRGSVVRWLYVRVYVAVFFTYTLQYKNRYKSITIRIHNQEVFDCRSYILTTGNFRSHNMRDSYATYRVVRSSLCFNAIFVKYLFFIPSYFKCLLLTRRKVFVLLREPVLGKSE